MPTILESLARTTAFAAGEAIHDFRTPAADGVTELPRSVGWAPWLASVGEALAAGILSIDAAAAIRHGLGKPDDTVTVEALTAAAVTLLGLAPTLTVDDLRARARATRDDLDEAGIHNRERDLRAKEYLRVSRRPDGMVAGSFLFAPENGAIVVSAIDAVTAPRRGGPRFVNPPKRPGSRRPSPTLGPPNSSRRR